MDPVVRCTDLCRAFEDGTERRLVLQKLSLCVERGELVTIVGESGSGKSTLLSAIGGLDRAFEGELELFGRALKRLSDAEVSRLRGRSVGFVFQSFHLLSHLTALENVLLPSLFGERLEHAEQRARDALARVGLAQREKDRPASLSGGQRQRVAIARALLTRPPLLLCDEPTGNLDPETSSEVGALFLELARERGAMLIVVTHNLEFARLFGRCLELRAGTLRDRDLNRAV